MHVSRRNELTKIRRKTNENTRITCRNSGPAFSSVLSWFGSFVTLSDPGSTRPLCGLLQEVLYIPIPS